MPYWIEREREIFAEKNKETSERSRRVLRFNFRILLFFRTFTHFDISFFFDFSTRSVKFFENFGIQQQRHSSLSYTNNSYAESRKHLRYNRIANSYDRKQNWDPASWVWPNKTQLVHAKYDRGLTKDKTEQWEGSQILLKILVKLLQSVALKKPKALSAAYSTKAMSASS